MSSISPELLFADSAWLRGLTRRLARDPDAADDLQQEVALAALSGPRPAGRAWLAKVARNLAALVHRRSAREAQRIGRLARPEAAAAAADLVETAELQQRAVAAVLALPAMYRDTILLRFLRGMSIDAAARHLGVPAETVRTRQKRALAQLRSELLPERSRFGGLAALLPVGLVMKIPVVVTAAAVCLLLGLATAPFWYPGGEPSPSSGGSPVPAAAAAVANVETPAPASPELVSQDPVREAAPMPVAPKVESMPSGQAADGRGSLEVTVVRAGGAVAADVSVLCRRSTGPARFATTGGDGVARFSDLAVGQYSIASSSSQPRQAAVGVGEATAVQIVLPAGRSLRGQVLDPDGVPVPDAEIIATQVGIWPAWPFVVAKTDRTGRFDVDGIGSRQSVGARHPRHGVSHSQVLSSDPSNSSDAELVIRFDDSSVAAVAAVRGRVVDSARRPVADAWVQVSRRRVIRFARDGKMRTPPPASLTRSDDDGEFVADWLGEGEYELFVYGQGFAPHRRKVEVRAGSREVFEVQLVRGASLSGFVTDEHGKAVAGAHVRLPELKTPHRVWITSEADGGFRFEDLPAGPLIIEVTGGSYSRIRHTLEIVGTEHHEWNPQFEVGGTITGRLLDENGAPLEGWSITRKGGGRYATSDADGRFKLADCKPEGNRLYIREKFGYVPYSLVLADVPAGAREREIRLSPDNAATAKFTGQCVDANGVPLAGVSIHLVQEFSVVHKSTKTAADGTFEVGPLPPGAYRVRPMHADYEFRSVDRELGPHAIEDLQQLQGSEPR